jgi:uncharacterized protein YbaR (Trm112 family)
MSINFATWVGTPVGITMRDVISQELLEILACPKCHTKVELKEPDHLRCPQCKVLYPIVDGIPVMLIEEAKPE